MQNRIIQFVNGINFQKILPGSKECSIHDKWKAASILWNVVNESSSPNIHSYDFVSSYNIRMQYTKLRNYIRLSAIRHQIVIAFFSERSVT